MRSRSSTVSWTTSAARRRCRFCKNAAAGRRPRTAAGPRTPRSSSWRPQSCSCAGSWSWVRGPLTPATRMRSRCTWTTARPAPGCRSRRRRTGGPGLCTSCITSRERSRTRTRGHLRHSTSPAAAGTTRCQWTTRRGARRAGSTGVGMPRSTRTGTSTPTGTSCPSARAAARRAASTLWRTTSSTTTCRSRSGTPSWTRPRAKSRCRSSRLCSASPTRATSTSRTSFTRRCPSSSSRGRRRSTRGWPSPRAHRSSRSRRTSRTTWIRTTRTSSACTACCGIAVAE
mmetsp:Transcript_59451/g.136022  ORF Transcript_59451/g.136022 Transcript_59451/m.136022 type:complete len:285 (-) Transcript_59451:391-1245(-)